MLSKIVLYGCASAIKRSTTTFTFFKLVLVPFFRRLIAREPSLMRLSFRLFFYVSDELDLRKYMDFLLFFFFFATDTKQIKTDVISLLLIKI